MNLLDTKFKIGPYGKVRCETGWFLAPEWSERLEDFDLWYVWDGQGRMQLRDRSIDLVSGTCLIMRPGGLYLAEHDPEKPLGVIYIHFQLEDEPKEQKKGATRLPPEWNQVQDPLYFSVNLSYIIDRLREGKASSGWDTANQLFRILLQELRNQSIKPAHGNLGPYEAVIRRQIASIREQPGSILKVRDLAEAAALSPDHYTRIFKRLAGCSPRQFIQEVRLERACQLLRETPLQISEIADQVGYADVFQFSRIFKSRIGKAPSRWR